MKACSICRCTLLVRIKPRLSDTPFGIVSNAQLYEKSQIQIRKKLKIKKDKFNHVDLSWLHPFLKTTNQRRAITTSSLGFKFKHEKTVALTRGCTSKQTDTCIDRNHYVICVKALTWRTAHTTSAARVCSYDLHIQTFPVVQRTLDLLLTLLLPWMTVSVANGSSIESNESTGQSTYA